MNKLTDAALKNATLKDKPYKLFDGLGLYVHIQPNGGKWWRLKYRFGGKERAPLALGTYPTVKLKEARAKRDAARKFLADGVDPGAKKKSDKRAAKLAAANSFELVAREYVSKQSKKWSPEQVVYVLRRLEGNVFPDIGARPITEIEAPELLDTLRKVEDRGAHEMAIRTLQYCSQVFRYAMFDGRCKHNVAADLRGALTTLKTEHQPCVPIAEAPGLLEAIDHCTGEPQTRLGLQLMALVFLRTKELIGGEWAEIDWKAKIWTVPESRMKMRRTHVVPLSRQSLAVLDELRALNGDGKFVFAGRTHFKHMSANTMLRALDRLGYRGEMTVHGFRALASTILNEESGFKSEVIERQLAHCERNEDKAAYDRAKHLSKRTELMQWYADRLDQAHIFRPARLA
jgi:integrase